MKIEIDQELLNKELSLAQQLTGHGTRSFEYLAMDVVDNKLTIHSSDMDNNFSSVINCQVAQEGTVCVDARKLTELVKLMSPGQVTLSINGTRAQVKSNKDSFKLSMVDRGAFPAVPVKKNLAAIEVPAKLLREAIEMVSFAIPSRESERYTMQCGHLVMNEEGFRLTTTDGQRIAYILAPLPEEPLEDFEALVPDRALQSIQKLSIGQKENISITDDENHVYVSIANRTFVTRKIFGKFPDVTKALVDGKPGYQTVTVNKLELQNALQKARLLADYGKPAVQLSVQDETMTISAQESSGEAEVKIAAQHISGLTMDLLMNAKLLLDFTAVVKGTEIVIYYKEPFNAIQCRPANETDYTLRYIAMPMRSRIVTETGKSDG